MQLFPEIELDFHLILGWLRNLIGLAYQAGQSPGLRQDNNTPDNGEEREAAKSKEWGKDSQISYKTRQAFCQDKIFQRNQAYRDREKLGPEMKRQIRQFCFKTWY